MGELRVMTRSTCFDPSSVCTQGNAIGQDPIDLDHLSEFTVGDRSVQNRILKTFIRQSGIDLQKLSKSKTIEDWREAAHSLKNSASGIGAWHVVRDAEVALQLKRDQLDLEFARISVALVARVEEANGFIEKILESD